MKRILLLALLLCPTAYAATIPLSWTPPTTATDGSALTGTAVLTQYRVEYGSCVGTGFGTKAGEFTVTAPAASATSPNLPAGTYCFRVYSRNAGGESLVSNVTSPKTIPVAPPNPPTNLTAADPVAFQYDAATKSMTRVGFTATGAPCGPTTMTVKGVLYCRLEQTQTDFVIWPQSPLQSWARAKT